MKTEVKEISPVLYEMTVTLEAEKATQDYRAVLQKMKNLVQIPGFRKGKAPLKMVEQVYGNYAREEFLNEKMEQCYKDGLQEIDLKPVSEGVPKNADWDKGKDLVFVYNFEVMPEIEIKNYKNLEIPFEEKEFTEDMVKAELEILQKQLATTMQPEKLELNDEIEIEIFSDDEDKELLQSGKTQFIKGEYAPAFYDNLMHATIGDEIKTVVYNSQDSIDEQTRKIEEENLGEDFLNKEFIVKIKSIQRTVLPEINDELAKDMEFDSLEDLKKNIEEETKAKLEKDNKDSLQGAIIERLIKENPFELPKSMIMNYAEALAKPYAKAYNTSIKELIPIYKSVAEFNMKAHYIWNEIEKLEAIEITDEDKENAIQEAAQNLKIDVDEYKKLYKKEIESESFKDTIIKKKLFDIVKSNAVFVPYPKKTDNLKEPENETEKAES